MFRLLTNTACRRVRRVKTPLEVVGGYSAAHNASSDRSVERVVAQSTESNGTGRGTPQPKSLAPYGGNDYYKILRSANEQLRAALASPDRFQLIDEREDRTDISSPSSAVIRESYGKYISQYRGTFLMKNPYDLTIYCQLFNHVRPRTVIEIGSYTGASAVWFSDTANLLGYDCVVYSVDIDHGLLDENIKKTKPETVNFIQGDATKLDQVLLPSMLNSLPHPWLVVEDCHESITTTITYLNRFMKIGDYLVIEDTSPYVLKDEESSWNSFTDKLSIVKKFLKGSVGRQYKVDSFFTDFFGYNCTWHWHGFLRKCDKQI